MFEIRNELKSLTQISDIGKINAVYFGLALGVLGFVEWENDVGRMRKAFESEYYTINEISSIDKQTYLDISNKLILSKMTVFAIKPWLLEVDNFKFEDVYNGELYLGGLRSDVTNNNKLVSLALKLTLKIYRGLSPDSQRG